MKIINTITAYPPSVGGAQIHQHILNQYLCKKHQVQVISHWDQNRNDWLLGTTLNAPSVSEDYRLDGVNIHRIGIKNIDRIKFIPHVLSYYFNIEFNAKRIAKYLQQYIDDYVKKSDLVHNIRVGREGISYASYYAAKKQNIPFVFTPLHHPKWVGWRYKTFIDLYQKADAIIALTPAERDILVELGVKNDKITITGIGPVLEEHNDPVSFVTAYNIKNSFVLFLGQHYSYKGYQEILKAAPLIWKKYPDLDFVFIGPSVKHSERFFEQYQDRRIHRLGKVNLQTKTNAISACSLLCVPSMQESFGGVYTEAWSFKKPVIGCPIPAVKDVITDGIDGVLVQQNPYEIAEAILAILNDEQWANHMGEMGYEKVQTQYTWQVISDKVDRLYHSLI